MAAQPDLLSETGFLVRDFPVPGHPYRPLVVLTPVPGENTAAVEAEVKSIARAGYGGVVLDPAAFGRDFLGEAWFELAGTYLDACRFTGLFLWFMDGFTIGPPLAAVFDEAIPGWRGGEIVVQSETAQGPAPFESTPPEPRSRLLAAAAYPAGATAARIDLRPYTSGGHLLWNPPPGQWEIVTFWACAGESAGPPAFNLADGNAAAAWLQIGFQPYQDFFGAHLGRTLQGFFIYCPSWPNDTAGGRWPLLAADGLALDDLLRLSGRSPVSSDAETVYAAAAAACVRRSYLDPLREWCGRNRLRLGGYRLGGRPLPGMFGALHLGGLPDLAPEGVQDLDELAGLAGLARFYRQEKVCCLFAPTGHLAADRAQIGKLAAAGADRYLVRKRPQCQPDQECALLDYAARVAMAISAGGPAAEDRLTVREDGRSLRQAGRQAMEASGRGLSIVCVPADAASAMENAGPANLSAGNGAAAAGEAVDPAPSIPDGFALCARKVEDWLVYMVYNRTGGGWRGPVGIPVFGAPEIWYPSTGEQRSVAPLARENGLSLPLAIESGETQLIVVRRPGRPAAVSRSRLITAHLTMGRSWSFTAVDGNIMPLSWTEQSPGIWAAIFDVRTAPDDLCLAPVTESGLVKLNGESLSAPCEAAVALPASLLHSGRNSVVIEGAAGAPRAAIRGNFACRGMVMVEPPMEMAGSWTQNGYPYFPGPGIYKQSLTVPAELIRRDLAVRLEIKALAESAAVRCNERTVGYLAWPPFRLELGSAAEALVAGDNTIELEIHAPASQPAWSFKGLLGEVSVIFYQLDLVDEFGFPLEP